MSKQNDFMDELLDKMISRAASELDSEESLKLEKPDEDIVFSARHESMMKKIFRKEKRRERIQKFTEISKVASLIIIISAGVIFTTVPESRGWISHVVNFVFEKDRPNTDYNFRPDKGMSYSDDNVILKYIPMGFKAVEAVESSRGVTIHFENGEEFFQFSKNELSVTSSVDTEGGTAKEITINGYKAIYVEAKNVNSLIWCDDKFAYSVIGNISQNELMRIGENLLN